MDDVKRRTDGEVASEARSEPKASEVGWSGSAGPGADEIVVRLTGDRALLSEAMALIDARDPADAVRRALEEMVERQRFLNWVAAHEGTDRRPGGSA
jgi:hypothetical protein